MSAFFIATSIIKDMEKFQEYAGKAGQTIVPFGGQLVTKGKAEKTLFGQSTHDVVGVIGFPDMDALDSWYQSPEYQALVPLRDSACDMTIVAHSVLA